MNSLQLAEICGLHAGDGYLRNDGMRAELDISGNVEEKEFYDNHVIPLFSGFFNITIEGKIFPSRNTYGFVIRDRKIIKFLHNLGFPYGNKTKIVEIPKFILKSKNDDTQRNFLRGLFDTDGCFSAIKRYGKNYIEFKRKYHYYPRISIVTCSQQLFSQTSDILKRLGFNFSVQEYMPKRSNESLKYIICIAGENNMRRWFETIGSNNFSKMSKYLIWKNFGFYPPKTTLEQRKQILKGMMHPSVFYGLVA